MSHGIQYQKSVHQLLFIMGQLIEYLTSVFTGKSLDANKSAATGHSVTFSDLSFGNAFGRADSLERNAMVQRVNQKNKRTIMIYEAIGAIAFLLNICLVAWPKIRTEDFDLFQPEGWQLITLTSIPLVVYLASFGAMIEVSKPLAQGAKWSDKNPGLDLNKNDFIHSIKVMTLLVALCQVSAIFSEQLLWSVVMIVPLWCYQLTSKLAHNEFERYSPAPKRQWAKLNVVRSPAKSASPSPQKQVPKVAAASSSNAHASAAAATPRTRTKRAVKSIITGVTDKYHAFEQNVAHQINTKIFTPLSPKKLAIE